MVPQVPVCTYTHVRQGDTGIAECVSKKTGTNWDRDQHVRPPAPFVLMVLNRHQGLG
jgi:hypothetical protein